MIKCYIHESRVEAEIAAKCRGERGGVKGESEQHPVLLAAQV
jgi:hypothetical protein